MRVSRNQKGGGWTTPNPSSKSKVFLSPTKMGETSLPHNKFPLDGEDVEKGRSKI